MGKKEKFEEYSAQALATADLIAMEGDSSALKNGCLFIYKLFATESEKLLNRLNGIRKNFHYIEYALNVNPEKWGQRHLLTP